MDRKVYCSNCMVSTNKKVLLFYIEKEFSIFMDSRAGMSKIFIFYVSGSFHI
ncbi:hypothetical protein B4135_2931 [Caldibacillus debilis]|uniref:Uncharacterized protein n=1 Tax=Caldibacillus debilis TaxID=301148 RepID=A0A150LLL9_9BACI|nr:hypothetical protein B4135_2931 [Caldibacillus debilis]